MLVENAICPHCKNRTLYESGIDGNECEACGYHSGYGERCEKCGRNDVRAIHLNLDKKILCVDKDWLWSDAKATFGVK